MYPDTGYNFDTCCTSGRVRYSANNGEETKNFTWLHTYEKQYDIHLFICYYVILLREQYKFSYPRGHLPKRSSSKINNENFAKFESNEARHFRNVMISLLPSTSSQEILVVSFGTMPVVYI